MPEKKTLNEDLFYKGSSASLPHLHTCENKVSFWDFKEFAVTPRLHSPTLLTFVYIYNAYANIYQKDTFAYVENADSSGVRYLHDIKLAESWSQLEALRVSSHTEELWYNGSLSVDENIYICVYGCQCIKEDFHVSIFYWKWLTRI